MSIEGKPYPEEKGIDALRRENTLKSEAKAVTHNKDRSLVKKIFGIDKISGVDISHEEALCDAGPVNPVNPEEISELNNVLGDAREHARERKLEYEREQKLNKLNKGYFEDEEDKKETLELLGLKEASVEDYKKWLKGYIQQGGKITHVYDYNMPKEFYIATKDFEMYPLFGANSINVIVPRNVKFLGGDLGHCNLYFEDGYRNEGNLVPIYKDIKF